MRLAVEFAPSVFFAPEVAVVATVHSSFCQKHHSRKKCEKAECVHLCVNARVHMHHVMQAWLHAKMLPEKSGTRKAASKAGSRQQLTTCRYGTNLTLLFATQGSSPVLEAKLTCAVTGRVVQSPTPVVFGGRPTRVGCRARHLRKKRTFFFRLWRH